MGPIIKVDSHQIRDVRRRAAQYGYAHRRAVSAVRCRKPTYSAVRRRIHTTSTCDTAPQRIAALRIRRERTCILLFTLIMHKSEYSGTEKEIAVLTSHFVVYKKTRLHVSVV